MGLTNPFVRIKVVNIPEYFKRNSAVVAARKGKMSYKTLCSLIFFNVTCKNILNVYTEQ